MEKLHEIFFSPRGQLDLINLSGRAGVMHALYFTVSFCCLFFNGYKVYMLSQLCRYQAHQTENNKQQTKSIFLKIVA